MVTQYAKSFMIPLHHRDYIVSMLTLYIIVLSAVRSVQLKTIFKSHLAGGYLHTQVAAVDQQHWCACTQQTPCHVVSVCFSVCMLHVHALMITHVKIND